MARLATRKKILRAGSTPMSVAEQVQHHMREIKKLFDEPKVTLVIRSPTMEGSIVFTNDQPEETIAAIRKMCTVIATPSVN